MSSPLAAPADTIVTRRPPDDGTLAEELTARVENTDPASSQHYQRHDKP
jgi:hypothetical protein